MYSIRKNKGHISIDLIHNNRKSSTKVKVIRDNQGIIMVSDNKYITC